MEQPLGFLYPSHIDECQRGSAQLVVHDSSQFGFGAMELLCIEIQRMDFVIMPFHTVDKTSDEHAVILVHRAKEALLGKDSSDGDEKHGKEVCADACVPVFCGVFGAFFLHQTYGVQQSVIAFGRNVQIRQPAQPVEESELDFMY